MIFHILIILSFISLPVSAQIITTFAGNGNPGFSGDGGPATNAQFFTPRGVAVDKWGNIYLADNFNNVIHKVDTNGIMMRFAGNGTPGNSGDGGSATSAQLQLYVTVGIAIDTLGNVYFGSENVIRKVNTSGVISTEVGDGSYGAGGDGGPASSAQLQAVTGLCFDKSGNLFIADADNHSIRKVNASGIISKIAGIGSIGFSGDGGMATNAHLGEPQGIAIDDSENLYIADFHNNRIRKINNSGIINTIAGGYPSGDIFTEGYPATNLRLQAPIGVCIDRFGNIYTSAAGDDIVQKITKNGLAYSIAGTGVNGYSGDGGPASSAKLNNPGLICFDNSGNLLITDRANYRFRKVWYSTSSVPPLFVNSSRFSIFPNPVSHNEFTCNITSSINEDANVVITNMLGQVVLITSCTTNKPAVITLNTPPGLYFISAHTSTGKITSKLVVE